MIMRTIKQYIPSKIPVDEIINNYPPVAINNFKRDNLIHILNLITEIPSNRERSEDSDGYVPLNSKKLQGQIHNYREYLDYLLSTGILETDGFYITGEKSTGYRINPEFMSEVVVHGIKDYFLVRKILKDKEKHQKTAKDQEHLIKWFDDYLTIDYEPAMKHLEEEKNQNIIAQVPNPFEKYNHTYRNIDRFNDKDFFQSVDSTVGRFHSNLTNMKSDYR